MDVAAEITAIVSVIVAVLGGVGIPLLLARRKKTEDTGMAEVVSWTNMNKALQDDVTRLRKELADSERDYQRQLDEAERRHREQIKQLEQDWDTRMIASRERITSLETELSIVKDQLTKAIRQGGKL